MHDLSNTQVPLLIYEKEIGILAEVVFEALLFDTRSETTRQVEIFGMAVRF